MITAIYGAIFMALAGILAIGVMKLVRRFRKEKRFSYKLLIVTLSAFWVIVIAPIVGGLIGQLTGETPIAVAGFIACWPFAILRVARIDFSSVEFGTTFGVEHRLEDRGIPSTSTEKLVSNVTFGIGSVVFLLLLVLYFSHR